MDQANAMSKKLSASAASFVPNANAAVFVPGQGLVQPAAPAAAQPAAPAPVINVAAQETPVDVVEEASKEVAAVTIDVSAKSPPKEEKPAEAPAAKKDDAESQPAAEAKQDASTAEQPAQPPAEDSAASASQPSASSAANSSAADQADDDDEMNDGREHLNIVFIGHVDAGKSTISGNLLYLSGQVDARTIEKYEREAKDKNRESWFLAYIMDTNEEERAKGKTVECGRAQIETPTKRYTILDAPGHKSYVPNMIGGASQADVAVLVISARKGEFETGFDRGGQTREHTMLAKTLGVRQLVIAVNKMDEETVQWSKDRFDNIVGKLTPFLKQSGFNVKKDVFFVPVSGLSGANLAEKSTTEASKWYDGEPLLGVLDKLSPIPRTPDGPVRLPVLDKTKDIGTVIMGKLESGTIREGDKLTLLPNGIEVDVVSVQREEEQVKKVVAGDNVKVKVNGVNEDEIRTGYVLSSIDKPAKVAKVFDAQLVILDLLDHKAIFTAGYKSILHLHTSVEECTIRKLRFSIDKKTGKRSERPPKFVKSGAVVVVSIELEEPVALETFKDGPQLGRFTLRDEGKTIGVGKVLRIPVQS